MSGTDAGRSCILLVSSLPSHQETILAAHLVHRRRLHTALEQLLHLTHAKGADAHAPDKPLPLRPEARLPALLAHPAPTDRAVHEVEVDVAEPARVERRPDRALRLLDAVVQLQLRGEADLRARRVRRSTPVADGAPDLGLVLVPRGRVLPESGEALPRISCRQIAYDVTVSSLEMIHQSFMIGTMQRGASRPMPISRRCMLLHHLVRMFLMRTIRNLQDNVTKKHRLTEAKDRDLVPIPELDTFVRRSRLRSTKNFTLTVDCRLSNMEIKKGCFYPSARRWSYIMQDK